MVGSSFFLVAIKKIFFQALFLVLIASPWMLKHHSGADPFFFFSKIGFRQRKGHWAWAKFLFCNFVLNIKIVMSTNFQIIMLVLSTVCRGPKFVREKPSHPVQSIGGTLQLQLHCYIRLFTTECRNYKPFKRSQVNKHREFLMVLCARGRMR